VNFSIRSIAASAAVTLLAACSGATHPALLQSGASPQNAARRLVESVRADERFGIAGATHAARMAARGPGYNASKKKTPTLFVSDLDAGEIRLYPANTKNPTQSGSITQGLSDPINVAVDSSGTLYVANNGSSTVTEYPFGQTSPSVTLSTSLVYPNGIAVDSAGTVYVTSGANVGNTYVLEFPKGATSPSAQVNGFGLAIGLSIDKNDNLYVADAHNNEVFEVAKGTTNPVNLGLSGLDDPTGVAIDPSGDLYVTNEDAPRAVNAFHPGKTSPFLSITDGIAGPYTLAFDSKGVLFVGNGDANPGYITAYKKNKTSPYEKFSNGIENPAGAAAYPPVGF
jgi:sugar lactone lactonase YvrE